MLRLTCILGTDEPIYLHAFGGRPPEPGKLCEGENKVFLLCSIWYAFNTDADWLSLWKPWTLKSIFVKTVSLKRPQIFLLLSLISILHQLELEKSLSL